MFVFWIAGGDHQNSLEQGLTDVSVVTGVVSALATLPLGSLISGVFRLAQVSVQTLTVHYN